MTMARPDETSGSMPWRRHAAFGLTIVALSLFRGADAYAQTKEELDKARVLFKEGVALSAANNCAAALTKYHAVANVKMTPQVAFNIAECEERLGRLVSALGNYRVAASMAEGDVKAKEVSSRVGERIEALDARVPKLTVKRGKGAETALIEFDGSELGAAQASAEIPVDPGSHTLVASVGGQERLRETVTLAEKEVKTFEVQLDLPSSKPGESLSAAPKPGETPGDAHRPKGRSKVVGAVVLGAGGVSTVLGVVFMALRGGTLRDLDEKCGGDRTCPPSAKSIADKGRLYTGLGEATIALGVVGVATGIFLLATSAPSAPKRAAQLIGAASANTVRRLALIPSAPAASMGGISLVGRF
jgi:hypothetical protein